MNAKGSQLQRRLSISIAVAIVVLLASAVGATASSAAEFTGDFETGNLSQFAYTQAIPGRVTVVKSPVAQGTYAGRFEVKEGDEEPDTKTPRAVVTSGQQFKEGETRYFHMRTRISSWDYAHFGIIWQLNDSGGSTPPLTLQLLKNGSTPELWLGPGNASTKYWEAPLPGTEQWFEITIRVTFGSKGSVSVWLDGEPQTLANASTTYEGIDTLGKAPVTDLLGISRSKSATGTAVVYEDDYRITEALEPAPFIGDFETGNLSQWNYVQAIPGRVTVVKSPVAQGTYAGRFEVREGDKEPDTGSNRAEVTSGGTYNAGDVRYFHIRMRVGSWDYKHWGLIWQLHDQTSGSPPVCLELLMKGTTPELWIGPGAGTATYWEAPLPGPETWFEIVIRVAFGTSTAGSVKVWLNGTPQTMANSTSIFNGIDTVGTGPDYDKMGIYRSKESTGTAVMYDDDYRISRYFP